MICRKKQHILQRSFGESQMFEMANNDSKIQPENRKAAKSLYYLLYEGFNQTTSSHKIFFIKKKKTGTTG